MHGGYVSRMRTVEKRTYDYAQMLCDLDVPLLFVDTPVMDMRPPLKADRLYMENRIEIQNAVAHMVQRGKKHISFAGDKNHCRSQQFMRDICKELQFGMIQFFQFGLLHLPKMQLITQLLSLIHI